MLKFKPWKPFKKRPRNLGDVVRVYGIGKKRQVEKFAAEVMANPGHYVDAIVKELGPCDEKWASNLVSKNKASPSATKKDLEVPASTEKATREENNRDDKEGLGEGAGKKENSGKEKLQP